MHWISCCNAKLGQCRRKKLLIIIHKNKKFKPHLWPYIVVVIKLKLMDYHYGRPQVWIKFLVMSNY